MMLVHKRISPYKQATVVEIVKECQERTIRMTRLWKHKNEGLVMNHNLLIAGMHTLTTQCTPSVQRKEVYAFQGVGHRFSGTLNILSM